MKIASAFIFGILLISSILPAQIPAFPGAQGFGALTTTGGRGGQVIYVTNLNCDGPGSLNEALATPGPKYILFKVSGIIDCAAQLEWGDCYVAGQTAPAGIIVRGIYIDDWYDANGGAKNIILRHLNSRPNTEQFRAATGWVMDDALRLDGASHLVIDHCSFANGTDEQVQISRSNNLSIQNCLLAEPIGDHYMFGGMLLNYSAANHRKDSISIHHNLWNRVGGRFPEFSCEQSGEAPNDMTCLEHPLRVELSNNLFWDQQIETYYNSGFYTSNQEAPGLQLHANFVNNRSVVRNTMCNAMFRILMLEFADNQLFVSGNTMSRYPAYQDYDLFNCCNDFCVSGNHPNTYSGLAQRRNSRHTFPLLEYTPTENLVSHILENVGAFNLFSPQHRDPMNRRLLQALQLQTIDNHPIDGQDYFQDAFLLDFNNPPAAPEDTDGDGMPNAWEIAQGLNPNLADHNGTQLSLAFTGILGYTNLECYLNQLADNLSNGTVTNTEPKEKDWARIHFDPSSQQLRVWLEPGESTSKPIQVQILDTSGKGIRDAVLQDSGMIQCSNLSKGVYFVHLQCGEKQFSSRIFI